MKRGRPRGTHRRWSVFPTTIAHIETLKLLEAAFSGDNAKILALQKAVQLAKDYVRGA